jgi:hypothetical protein
LRPEQVDENVMNTYSRVFTAVLAVTVLGGVLGADAAAQAYKYKDEKGNVVFSDRPPPAGQAAEAVKLEKSPPTATTAAPDAVREDAREYMKQGNEELKTEQTKRKQAKADDADRKQACDQARRRLQELTTGPPNRRMVRDEKGLPRRVGGVEMTENIDAARADVTRACARK